MLGGEVMTACHLDRLALVCLHEQIVAPLTGCSNTEAKEAKAPDVGARPGRRLVGRLICRKHAHRHGECERNEHDSGMSGRYPQRGMSRP
jgi:hypothetical protein